MGRRIMEMHVRVPRQPQVPLRLVGRQIVENDMDFLALILLDDAVHEIAELHPAAAFVVPSSDLTGADVERGEQGRGAVSLVVVRLAGHRPAIRQLQISLSTLQCLDRWLSSTESTTALIGGAI